MNSGKVLTNKEIKYLNALTGYSYNEETMAKRFLANCTLEDLNKTLEHYHNIRNKAMVEKINELIDLYKYYEKNFLKNKNAKYHCDAKQLNEKMAVLNTIYQTIKSNDTDYHKAEVIMQYFSKANLFYKAYNLIAKYGKKDSDLDQARDALNHFDDIFEYLKKCEDEGIFKNIQYLQSLKQYIEVKDYASFVVKTYASREDHQELDFCDRMGIGKLTFDYCLEVVETLDYDTYKLYLQKKEMEVQWKLDVLEDLANGITTGVLKDGTPFDIIEFIKRFPLKKNTNIMPILTGFLTKNHHEELVNILNTYVWSNSIDHPNFFDPLDLNALYSGCTYIGDMVITPEIKKGIIAYLHQNNIPIIYKTYLVIRDRYIDGEIKLPTCENIEHKITLIP